jgi:hypothetical protein
MRVVKSLETFRGALRCTYENALSNLIDSDEPRGPPHQ